MDERVELQPDYYEQIQADPHKRELHGKFFGEAAIAKYHVIYGLSYEDIRAVLQDNEPILAQAKVLNFLGPIIDGELFKKSKSSRG